MEKEKKKIATEMRKQHFTQMGLSEAICLNLPHSDIWPYSASKFGGRNRRPKAENFPVWPKGRNSGIPLKTTLGLSRRLI